MGYAATSSNYQEESGKELLKAVLEILHCHVIFFLVVWLALCAPLFCQYHGLMIHFGEAHHQDSTESDQADTAIHFHQMASNVTMVMSLFVAAIPGGLLLLSPANVHWVIPADPPMPVELTL